MNTQNLEALNSTELQRINGGVAPVAVYLAAYATIYATAHVAAYYKGYGDAHNEIEPCEE